MTNDYGSPIFANVCIHEVGPREVAGCPWIVDRGRLDEMLLELCNRGWRPVSAGASSAPVSRQLLLTVDDAREGAITWLSKDGPALAFQAVVFPIPHFIDHPESVLSRESYSRFASWGLLGDALARGHLIGSHGMTHTPLTALESDQLEYELSRSKRILETMLQVSVGDLAFPYGRFNRAVLSAARKNGYQRFHTTKAGLMRAHRIICGMQRRFVVRSDAPDLGLTELLCT